MGTNVTIEPLSTGEKCQITKDASDGGQVLFQKGDIVRIEQISPHHTWPEYRYVVRSGRTGSSYHLDKGYLRGLEQIVEENAALEQAVAAGNLKLATLTAECADSKNQINHLEKETAKLLADSDKASKKIKSLETKVSRLDDKIRKSDSALGEAEGTIAANSTLAEETESEFKRILAEKDGQIKVEQNRNRELTGVLENERVEVGQLRDRALRLLPLGGSRRIGANSYLLGYQDEWIVLDYGADPTEANGKRRPLPVPPGKKVIGLVLSHCHLDHSGSIQYFRQQYPEVPIFSSKYTPQLVELLHKDMLKIARETGIDCGIASYQQIEQMIEKMEESAVCESQWKQVADDCRIKFHPAGHILGAEITEIEWKDKRIVYTGDFCCHEQGLVPSAFLDDIEHKPDLLICEATYAGDSSRPEWSKELERLQQRALEILEMHGVVLLPSYAVGRSQELVYEFGRAEKSGELPQGTMLCLDGLARGICEASYRMLKNETFEDYFRVFKTAKQNGSGHDFRISDNQLVIASSGMLHKQSTSRHFLDQLIAEQYDLPVGVFVSGYMDKTSRSEWEEMKENGFPSNFTFDEFNLSAHATSDDILDLAALLEPRAVCLVHWGDQGREDADREDFENSLKKRMNNGCTVLSPLEHEEIPPLCN